MSVRVTGDFAALRSLRSSFEALSRQSQTALVKTLGEEALKLTRESFRAEQSPNGQPWAPLRYRNGRPLRDTGRLVNSFTRKAVPGGFAIATSVVYASAHQYGARLWTGARLPPRPFFPVPPSLGTWEAPLLETANAELRRLAPGLWD